MKIQFFKRLASAQLGKGCLRPLDYRKILALGSLFLLISLMASADFAHGLFQQVAFVTEVKAQGAEVVTPGAPAIAQGKGFQEFLSGTLMFISLGFLAFYLLVVKPAQSEEETKKSFFSSLKKGDDVLTSGGIVGRIVQIKENSVVLEISPKIQVRVMADYLLPLQESQKESSKETQKDS